MGRIAVMCGLMVILIAGCNPSVRVVKNPGDKDKGIRYYRPKPYLFLSPGGTTTIDKDKNAKVSPSDQYVNVELRYLPDFTEEYSINVTPGLGTAKVNMTLQDGWNLTSINQELDSNVDDNIKAVAELTKAVGGLIGTASDSAKPGDTTTLAKNVSARNVPLGFYEAVIGRDNCGRKQMYGWRYIGFTPFAQCPIYPTGQEMACCNNGTLELFGLVFENGVMVFRPLHQVREIPDVLSSLVEKESTPARPTAKKQLSDFREKLETDLRAKTNDQSLTIVDISIEESPVVFKVKTSATASNVTQAISELTAGGDTLLGSKPFTVEVVQPPQIPLPTATNRLERSGRAALAYPQ